MYRDIKLENAGFDVRGNIKVFDFGLCKSLDPKLETQDGTYKLTSPTGTFPYMAPEVALCEPYNTSADVFSFSILLWEILSLKVPFGGGLSRKEYIDKVSIGGLRPPITSSWPSLTRSMLKEAWDVNPKKRPDFKKIAALIRADLNAMTEDFEVQRRTVHMTELSERSMQNDNLGNVRAMELLVGTMSTSDETSSAITLSDCA